MKLDPKGIRYLTADDWRVLTAVEMGSRNHELIPVPLITQIASLRSSSGVQRSISALAKLNLVAKVKNAKYDGYRLTYGGLDYLALNAHRKADCIYSVGNQIGVGKESDVFVVAGASGAQRVLKIHRLGRISFRAVKNTRDYLRKRQGGSWMYMSRLAATKEFTCMTKLWEEGLPVPEPLGQNRHTLVMALVDGFPLRQVSEVPDPAALYADLIELAVRLARHGLIHGDYNEFNIMIVEETLAQTEAADDQRRDSPEADTVTPQVRLKPILIDFPQMLSTSHPNAEYYFDRDIACIKRFFSRRFRFTSDDSGPHFSDVVQDVGKGAKRLDVEVEAAGFSKKMAKELESYMQDVGTLGDGGEAVFKGGGGGSDGVDEERNGNDDDESERAEPEHTVDGAWEPLGHADAPDGTGPSTPELYPVVSPLDAMTPLDIQDKQFAFQAAAAMADVSLDDVSPLPPSEVPPRPKSKLSSAQAAGWSI